MIGLDKKNKVSTEISTKKKQESKYKLVGQVKPQRGHTLFEVSKDTLEISIAKFEMKDAEFTKAENQSKSKKVIVKEGFFYITALNVKNCKKKIIKMLNITKADLAELEKKVALSKIESK